MKRLRVVPELHGAQLERADLAAYVKPAPGLAILYSVRQARTILAWVDLEQIMNKH